MQKDHISKEFKQLQNRITTAITHCDGGAIFHEDNWKRDGGGGGRSRVIVQELNGVAMERLARSLKKVIK